MTRELGAGNIKFWGYVHLDDWYKENSDTWIDWTTANFQNQLDWEDGIIITDNNLSPQQQDLILWSDVVYISWITHAPSTATIRGLKRVVRANIANDDTKAQVKRAFENSGLETVPVWPGHKFEIDPLTFIDYNTGLIATPFMAMLGSKNEAGVAYLLLQHKAAMGFKFINAIRVWAEKEWTTTGDETKENFREFTPYMSFEIVDIPTDPRR
ncbi:hypothetical protein BHYA_0279g00020 [Botrytis hyacinthi]|uniref:Uncharacterized protein n=1 Tax=Botrytis hyacinthi TaxID=278943 RepID=A0A4Z1G7H8_9HELO|nr:hypothetical protein BHYA_0279g00020 [Botrytis hyacinthi]